jgi:hypothetical protein
MTSKGFAFLVDWGLNSGLQICKAGTLQLESQFQSLLLWLFGDGLMNYLPSLPSNRDPSNLSLSRS